MWQNFVITFVSSALYDFTVSMLFELLVQLYFVDMHNWFVQGTFNLPKVCYYNVLKSSL